MLNRRNNVRERSKMEDPARTAEVPRHGFMIRDIRALYGEPR